ncbi:MAG: hypothetical protein AAB340_03665 [Patescibacteria group bacterium]
MKPKTYHEKLKVKTDKIMFPAYANLSACGYAQAGAMAGRHVLSFKFYNSRGFVISVITFFVLIIMISIAVTMSALVFYRQQIATNFVKSTQAYYAAEAGVEDALILLKNNPNISSLSYNLSVGDATTRVTINPTVGGSRVIDSQGNDSDRLRNIQTVYSIDSEGISFFYGAQVGDGGLEMNNGSRIKGNVFSTGNIRGANNAIIDNDVIVSGNEHSIDDIIIKGNALTYSCLSPAVIEKNLTYVIGGTRTCKVQGSITTQSEEIPPVPLPISQAQIDKWKTQATDGGVINGSVTISNNQTQRLGPVKITGSLTVSNNATLTMTGTIYVVGDISVSNNGKIKLDSAYGSMGGVLVSDKAFSISNNGILQGSGQSGSYILVLSTYNSDSAVGIDNNATGAIFYASDGRINVSNSASVKGLTGYKIKLSNNAVIEYEIGLQNVFFSTGPSGGWKILSWGEK